MLRLTVCGMGRSKGDGCNGRPGVGPARPAKPHHQRTCTSSWDVGTWLPAARATRRPKDPDPHPGMQWGVSAWVGGCAPPSPNYDDTSVAPQPHPRAQPSCSPLNHVRWGERGEHYSLTLSSSLLIIIHYPPSRLSSSSLSKTLFTMATLTAQQSSQRQRGHSSIVSTPIKPTRHGTCSPLPLTSPRRARPSLGAARLHPTPKTTMLRHPGLQVGDDRCGRQGHAQRAEPHGPGRHRPREEEGAYFSHSPCRTTRARRGGCSERG